MKKKLIALMKQVFTLREQFCCLKTKVFNEESGWWNIQDNTFTVSSPQSVPANTRTLLQINSDSIIESFSPNSILASSIWDDSNNAITPLAVGDSYVFRVSMTVDPALNNRNFTVDLDIGGSQGIIFERTIRLARGAGVDTKVSETYSIFALNTFVSNGGNIYVTCDGDVDIYDISLFIQKI